MTFSWELAVATGSAFFAGIGLLLNWKAIHENNKTRQLQLLNDCFKSIKETELLLYKEYKDKDKQTKKEWDSLHFNSVEQFAFLVNEKFIKNKKLIGFFDDAIIMWYEQLFVKHYEEKEINDDKLFPEFKKLYYGIKSKSLKN